jgi:hypothetical protein
MPFAFVDAFFGLLQLAFNGLPLHFDKSRKLEREKAELQLYTYRITSAGGTPVLDGSSAQTLMREESFTSHNGKVHDYVLTVFIVTQEDRYFLLKSNPAGKPYIKELSVSRAQLVLKGKFRPFARADA